RLFPALRSFDGSSVREIFAQCPDSRGLGLAVGNRLKRAAGFHVVESDVQRIVLGLTGGTCSGKTTALSVLRDMGAAVIDCDYVYHRLLEENETMRNEINSSFPGVFSLDGKLNRRKLGEEVFAKKERMDCLNGIVYKYLLPILESMIDSVREGLCVVDGVTLLESGLDRLCDKTVAVTAPIEVRVRRVMARDRVSEEYARLRISAQKTDEYYRSKCDYELSSAVGTEREFREEAGRFFKKLVETREEEKRHGVRKPQAPVDEEN
ncbi:MAG: dephospho-CoA kinase, partial [Oscillibacter sp.]|nr:dephospho-CoA kinase [Oscillibacter sp.]